MCETNKERCLLINTTDCTNHLFIASHFTLDLNREMIGVTLQQKRIFTKTFLAFCDCTQSISNGHFHLYF